MLPVCPAPGGQETGPNPTDRGKLGSKRHIVVDARGIPLAITVTGANRHDSMAFEPTLDAIPAISGLNGQPRERSGKLHAGKGYDFARCRRYLKQRVPRPVLPVAAWKARSGSGDIDGWSNARMPGLPVSANCAFVSSGVSTFIALCFPWLLPLSARVSLRTCVSGS